MIYAKELQNKKEHAEQLLAQKLEDVKWFKKNDESKNFVNKQIKSNLEDSNLEVEALQDFIDGIDNKLRNKTMLGEKVQSPKDVDPNY